MQEKILKIKKFVEENNFKDLENFLDWFYKKICPSIIAWDLPVSMKQTDTNSSITWGSNNII